MAGLTSGLVRARQAEREALVERDRAREIVEEGGAAVYYIGETPVANRETLVFDISVVPEGSDTRSEVRFKREFYTD